MRAAIRFSQTFSVVTANASGIGFPDQTACSLYPTLVRLTPRLQVASRSPVWLGVVGQLQRLAVHDLHQRGLRLAVHAHADAPLELLEVRPPRAAAHRRLVGQRRGPRRGPRA